MTSTMMRDAVISFPMLGDLHMNPPASFPLFGREIYWYGVILALAFLAVLVWVVTHAKNFGIAKDDVYDEAIGCIILGVLGCRIYYVAFQWDYYSRHLNEIIRVWDGGIAMYGGIIAAVIFLLFFTRKRKISFGALLDADASGMLLGHSIGRWGNFINREAFGVPAEPLSPKEGQKIRRTGLSHVHLLVRPRPRHDRGTAHRQPVPHPRRHPGLPGTGTGHVPDHGSHPPHSGPAAA